MEYSYIYIYIVGLCFVFCGQVSTDITHMCQGCFAGNFTIAMSSPEEYDIKYIVTDSITTL